MSGMPAARQWDLTVAGPILQGSPTVLIGAAGGKACAVCPKPPDAAVQNIGNPVNPALGAKVLLGQEDLDFALPGPLALVWQRQYSSYVNVEHGASCGVLGYGWKQAIEVWIEHEGAGNPPGTRLFDAAGRCISFGALAPGQSSYSESEDLWLLRGGAFEGMEPTSPQPAAHRDQLAWAQQGKWAHLPRALRADAQCILAASATGSTVWVFRPEVSRPEEGELTKPRKPSRPRWRLRAMLDRFGRSQELSYAHQGPLAGQLVEIKDGVGRRYQLSYERVRAERACREMAGVTLGADNGIRLTAVSLIHNPQHSSQDPQSQPDAWRAAPTPQQPWTLVSYAWDASGNLSEVRDRSGQVTRRFEYDSAHRMVMHQERSGVQHRYVYEDTADEAQLKAQGHLLRPGAKVVAQNNEAGELSYRFEYLGAKEAAGTGSAQSSACRVTDSLGRVSLYHFEGSAGLKRLVGLTHPDGSQERWGYDAAGRRTQHLDELGRQTYWRYDGRGQLLGVQRPGGLQSSQGWGEVGSEHEGLLISSTDEVSRTSRYVYDQWGRLVEHQVGRGEEAQRTRWKYAQPQPHGANKAEAGAEALAWIEHPIEVTDPQGGRKHLGYDGCGQLASYTDCSGQSTHWRFDVWGALIEVRDALGQQVQHSRDAQGRVIRTRQADGRELRIGYNAAGQLQSIEQSQEGPGNTQSSQDSQRSTTVFTYDRWGQLLQREHGGLGIAFEYDAAGRLRTLTNENGARTTFDYDSRDRLVQEVGFDGRTQRNRFDAGGQLIEQWDGMAGPGSAIVSRYLYDKAGRLQLRLVRTQPPHPQENPDPDLIEVLSFEHDQGGALQEASHWQLQPLIPGELLKLLQEEDPAQPLQPRPTPGSDWFALSPEQLQRLWQASQGQHWLQLHSRASLQRDSLGRLVAETQSLNLNLNLHPGREPAAGQTPAQWEHHIAHRLGALGQRHSSELQGLGEIHWQTYGSGHVHGLLLGQQPLIDFERDGLHREVSRRLHALGQDANPPVIEQRRQLDAQGRLLSQHLKGLAPLLGSGAQISQAQQPLIGAVNAAVIGAVQERQYHYDALGQLVAVRSPGQMQSYRFDAAQRLIAAAHSQLQAGQSEPVNQVSTWRLDPAGNRLPEIEQTQAHSGYNDPQHNANWGEQVRRQLHNPHFDLLERRPQGAGASGHIECWPDNRIALHAGVRYRFDAHGNRIHAQHPGGAQEHYRYNALHQLVEHTRIEPAGEAGLRTTQTTTTHYRYDPFGRRLSKSRRGQTTQSQATQSTAQQTTSQTIYYGWDGDRLVHVEDDRHIRHTVYEAGSFVPMLQLQRSKGAKNLALLTLGPALGQLAPAQQKQMQDALAQALKAFDPQTASGLPAGAQKQMNSAWGPEMNQLVRRGLNTMQQAQAEEEARFPIEVRHIVCDHLGTPLALIDASGPHQGQITWAARYGAWGDIEAEYNPYQIEQLIRFQGQQFDPETGLHYNRFRYYDPAIGGYITQDPIGLWGGWNKTNYVKGDPVNWIDPIGWTRTGAAAKANIRRSQEIKSINDAPKKTGEKIQSAWDAGEEFVDDLFGGVEEFINNITGKNVGADRVDEAVVCTKQYNDQTKETTKPSDVLAADSRGVGVVRAPTPSEVNSLPDVTCVERKFRQMQSGALPGLEPGKPKLVGRTK